MTSVADAAPSTDAAPSIDAAVEAVRTHLDGLRVVVADLSPEAVTGDAAVELVTLGIALERVGASLRTRYARRVETTGAFVGHKHVAGWLAEKAGESVGQAQGTLKTASQLAETPLVDRAFGDGRLSLAQAQVAADASAADPAAQETLLEVAATGSLKDLKAEAARVKRRAFGEASMQEREARAHRRRYCRIWSPPEGGVRLDAWLPTVDGARVKAALDQETDRVFKEAWAAGVRDRPDAYRADALVRAVCGEGSPPAQVAVRVDAGTLRRGFVEGDEVCEIPGIGPIPVDTARDLLGDAAFHVVVTDGIDVKAVTSKKRTIPAALRRALIERDQTCAVPGCDATQHLQIDHRWDFSKGGPTSLSNTCRLCGPHHRMKTTMGFRLVETDGVVRWVGPSG
ncbi:MAG TPA: DUF222 domain-containing protein [Acidimicrobiales bacterium]